MCEVCVLARREDPEGGRGAIQYEGGMPLVFERYAGEEIGVKRPWVHRGGLCMGKNWGQHMDAWMHQCVRLAAKREFSPTA
jgi:hypothetical protein